MFLKCEAVLSVCVSALLLTEMAENILRCFCRRSALLLAHTENGCEHL